MQVGWLALAAGGASMALVCLTMPAALAVLRRLCPERIGDASPRLAALHAHKQATPTMGAVVPLAVLMLVAAVLVPPADRRAWGAVAATLVLAAVGLIDDLYKLRRGRGLRPTSKLTLQFLAAVPAAWLLWVAIEAGSFDATAMGTVAVTALWIVGFANAVNLTDGLDGLAGGCVLLTLVALAAGLACQGALEQTGLIVVVAAAAGAILGFLRFNLHPARVFMGDTGSLACGALVAAVARVAGQEIVLLVAGLVFLVETASVALQVGAYRLTRRRPLRCAPLHHHFQFLGWPEPRVVRSFWLVAAACCALACLLAVGDARVPPAPTSTSAATVAGGDLTLGQETRVRQLRR